MQGNWSNQRTHLEWVQSISKLWDTVNTYERLDTWKITKYEEYRLSYF